MDLVSTSVAANSMENAQLMLTVATNNIANLSVVGYKRNEAEFTDTLCQTVVPAGADNNVGSVYPVGVQISSGARLVGTPKVYTQGAIVQTGNEMDLAIEGEGFFVIEGKETFYTRDGRFKKDPATRKAVTSQGLPVSGFPDIPEDAVSIFVSAGGVVTITKSDNSTVTGTIKLAKFNNPRGLEAHGNGLLKPSKASGEAQAGEPDSNGFGLIRHKSTETSNVNPVTEMVNAMFAQRHYGFGANMVKASDEMASSAVRIMG
jgi:flagellar basal-body rod protein FlgG